MAHAPPVRGKAGSDKRHLPAAGAWRSRHDLPAGPDPLSERRTPANEFLHEPGVLCMGKRSPDKSPARARRLMFHRSQALKRPGLWRRVSTGVEQHFMQRPVHLHARKLHDAESGQRRGHNAPGIVRESFAHVRVQRNLVRTAAHRDKVDGDQSTETPKPDLPDAFVRGRKIEVARETLGIRRSRTGARINIDRNERRSRLDYQSAAAEQRDFNRACAFQGHLDRLALTGGGGECVTMSLPVGNTPNNGARGRRADKGDNRTFPSRALAPHMDFERRAFHECERIVSQSCLSGPVAPEESFFVVKTEVDESAAPATIYAPDAPKESFPPPRPPTDIAPSLDAQADNHALSERCFPRLSH